VSLYRGFGDRAPSRIQRQSSWSGSQGRSPPEAEALLVFESLIEAANLPTFLKFRNAKIRYLCYFCKEIMGGHETGGLEQNWGPVPPPRPGPKTATGGDFCNWKTI